jgi:NTE family protein
VYAGLSYETGNVWYEEDSDLDDLLWSSTVFLGADTLLGPMYFGYAIGGDDRDRWYFNIGASF